MIRGAKSSGAAAKCFRFIERCLILLSTWGSQAQWRICRNCERTKRNPRPSACQEDEVLAWHLTLPIDEHKSPDVEGEKELLVLVQETFRLGETPWAQRDQCLLIDATSSSRTTKPISQVLRSLATGGAHPVTAHFFRSHPQIHALRRTFGPAAVF